MKQGRETTQEERIAIVKECLENGSNFGETAMKHKVSYQQIYTWVKKFKQLGEAGFGGSSRKEDRSPGATH